MKIKILNLKFEIKKGKYFIMAFICFKPKGSCKTCPHYRYSEDKNKNICFAQVNNERENKIKYKNIERTRDKQYLYDNLSNEKLKEIDDILEAYFRDKIDFVVPVFENGEVDFCGEFELIINDDTYEKTGNELLVMKWVEDYEDTGYLMECMYG